MGHSFENRKIPLHDSTPKEINTCASVHMHPASPNKKNFGYPKTTSTIVTICKIVNYIICLSKRHEQITPTTIIIFGNPISKIYMYMYHFQKPITEMLRLPTTSQNALARIDDPVDATKKIHLPPKKANP